MGSLFLFGKTFINKECTWQCRCNDNGGTLCVSLCPPSVVQCPHGYSKEIYKNPVGNSNCTCEKERCKGRTLYWNFESFRFYIPCWPQHNENLVSFTVCNPLWLYCSCACILLKVIISGWIDSWLFTPCRNIILVRH